MTKPQDQSNHVKNSPQEISTADARFGELARSSRPPGSDIFTLDISNYGGRRARHGFASQDLWIAYVLTGLAAGEEDFICARIEGVEDFEVIVGDGERWTERY